MLLKTLDEKSKDDPRRDIWTGKTKALACIYMSNACSYTILIITSNKLKQDFNISCIQIWPVYTHLHTGSSRVSW